MHGSLNFLQSVLEEYSIKASHKLLLACSGGKDSMCLCQMLCELNYRPAVAHVNFKLRGAESDGDQQFVREFCEQNGLDYYTQSFDTEKESLKNGESIQMAARRLRYDWLLGLMAEDGFHRILTAHHDRDQAETILLNLMRGTGSKGLMGMQVDEGRIFRPLLHMPYALLADYALVRKVEFREDSSNASIKYKRNFIRHVVLNPWEEEFPGTIRQINRTSDIMREVNGFLDEQFQKEAANFVSFSISEIRISFDIRLHPYARLLMRFLLHDSGMADQSPYVLESVGRVGAIFRSATHELLTDRNHWVLKVSSQGVKTEFIDFDLPKEEGVFKLDGKDFQLRKVKEEDFIPRDSNSVWILESEVKAGLKLRNWQMGDKLIPFGMKGKKKLSDLFVDEKINRFRKDKQLVLINSKEEILWVCGLRSSEMLRVDAAAENLYWLLSVGV